MSEHVLALMIRRVLNQRARYAPFFDVTARKLAMPSTGWSGGSTAINSIKSQGQFVYVFGRITLAGALELNLDDDVYAMQVDHGQHYGWTQNGGNPRVGVGSTYVSFKGHAQGLDNDYLLGEHWRFLSVEDIQGIGGVDGGSCNFRLDNLLYYPQTIAGYAGAGTVFKKARGKPTIVLTFDDGGNGILDHLSYITDNNLKATIYMPWAKIGDTGKYTVAQLQQLAGLGWDVQLNGTRDDASMISRLDVASCVAELQEGINYLSANGINSNARHICYPFGQFRDRTVVVKSDISGSFGSSVLTMGSTSGISAGMNITHRQLPFTATVISVDSATQITVSNPISNVSVGGAVLSSVDANARFDDQSEPFYTGRLQAGLLSAGIVSARTTKQNTLYSKYGVSDDGRMYLPSYGTIVTPQNPSAGMEQTWINEVKKYGTTLFVTLHNITNDSPSNDYIDTSFETFKKWMDPLIAARNNGEIDILTVDEWYKRDCESPRQPPL